MVIMLLKKNLMAKIKLKFAHSPQKRASTLYPSIAIVFRDLINLIRTTQFRT